MIYAVDVDTLANHPSGIVQRKSKCGERAGNVQLHAVGDVDESVILAVVDVGARELPGFVDPVQICAQCSGIIDGRKNACLIQEAVDDGFGVSIVADDPAASLIP